jgi:hypothetical protein
LLRDSDGSLAAPARLLVRCRVPAHRALRRNWSPVFYFVRGAQNRRRGAGPPRPLHEATTKSNSQGYHPFLPLVEPGVIMPHLTPQELDEILSVQLLLAWAGETPSGNQPRLGWWKTDVIDEEAGGDLWKRLLPRTHRWAGLDAARRAAYLTDERLRRPAKNADSQRTLFHFGFEIDEALAERLAHHVLEARTPVEVFPLLSTMGTGFDRARLVKALGPDGVDASFKAVAGGRQLKKATDETLPVRARRLGLALLSAPTSQAYPVPFVLEETSIGKR